MKPCTPLQIKEYLGLSWDNLRHLNKNPLTRPPEVTSLDDPRFEAWATRGFSGELIHNTRVYKPVPSLKLDTPQHSDSEPLSLYDALRRLGRRSPAYSNALIGCDAEGNYALIGCNLYVKLGNWSEAMRWLMTKVRERKAA